MKNINYRDFTAEVKYNEKKGMYRAYTKGLVGLRLYAAGSTFEELEQNYQDAVDRLLHEDEVMMDIRRYNAA